MRLPGRKRLATAQRWARSRLRSRALILGYHRISSPDWDPFGLCVSLDTFRVHIDHLRRSCKLVPLSRLVEDLAKGKVEPGSVALTFDDAYLETLQVVEPILRAYEIPATVFVTTSTLGQELWWDRLSRLHYACRSRQQQDTRPGTIKDFDRDFMGLYRRLLHSEEKHRGEALKHLEETAATKGIGPPDSRVVSAEELATLADSPNIEIGSHSVSHPLMAVLSREEQESEVRGSRSFLEDLLGRNVSLFSYPNGSLNPISEELVRAAGFAGACGSHRDVVTASSNRYRLPRFWPVDLPHALNAPLRVWLG